ncbi:MAG: ATP phosphoribosyltransferase regulatory subunit [Betaproteobacteria bacterium HGW-Betaproteobacteria-11]|nr:MAG: ATP phosphoribosyltransferase regulatory subunit [Betaproteobacteria bacterium HGW-Betaproteobacteria-11]
MTHRRWLLPESIEDALPPDAVRLEVLRRRVLDAFSAYGYDLIVPPLLEFVESLLPASRSELDLRTFKLVDQVSGRSMGIRADITPQVARIDAHILNHTGVTRLCYCGSVVHTLPACFNSTREPLQIGAEIYGHAGLEADIEIIGLLADALRLCDVPALRLDLGHVAIFRALADGAGLAAEAQQDMFLILQRKDVPALLEMVTGLAEPFRSALLSLPDLHGGRRVLAEAALRLPPLPQIRAALADLERLSLTGDLPIGFDLADLRGYEYHSGVVFAAYCAGSASALALGGRYDGLGCMYGRSRPATGFSMDLREVARLSPNGAVRGAVLAPWPVDALLQAEIARLRAMGERVMVALPGHEGQWREAGCDRVLVCSAGQWNIGSLKED